MRKLNVEISFFDNLPRISGTKKNTGITEKKVVDIILKILIDNGFLDEKKLQKRKYKNADTLARLVALAHFFYRHGFTSYWIEAIWRNRTLASYYTSQEPNKKLLIEIEKILRRERDRITKEVHQTA